MMALLDIMTNVKTIQERVKLLVGMYWNKKKRLRHTKRKHRFQEMLRKLIN